MKKTLIVLLALAGVAVGEVVTLDFGNTLPVDTTEGTLLFTNWKGVQYDGNSTATLTYLTSGTVATDNLVGNFLLNDDAKYVQYSFTLQNNTTEAISLSNISFGVIAANSSGTGQGSDRTGSYNLTIGETTHNIDSLTLGQGGVENTASFDLNDIILDADQTINVSLKWQKPSGSQYYTGLANMSVTTATASPAVPEPTTATLSLLALAGLAARRRRASR